MGGRRGLLKTFLGLWLLPLGGLGLAASPAAAAALRPGFHLVNGWILTDRDLAALRRPATPPRG